MPLAFLILVLRSNNLLLLASVLAVKYKDGIMMAADNLSSSCAFSLRYSIHSIPFSLLRFSCMLQGRAASTSCWRLHGRRCERRRVRLSIPSAPPQRPHHLRRNQLTRWAHTRSCRDTRIFVAAMVQVRSAMERVARRWSQRWEEANHTCDMSLSHFLSILVVDCCDLVVRYNRIESGS